MKIVSSICLIATAAALSGCFGSPERVAAKANSITQVMGAAQQYTENCYIKSTLKIMPAGFFVIPTYEHERICNPHLKDAPVRIQLAPGTTIVGSPVE